MLKIALLTTDSVPQVGGIAEYLHGLLSSADSISWSVYSTIPTSGFEDASLPYTMHRIPESRRLGKRWGDQFFVTRKFNSFFWQLNRPREGRSLVRSVQEGIDPDLIAIGRWCEQSSYWCSACRKYNIPYILFAYGWELIENLPPKLTTARRQDFSSAKNIISISKATTQAVLNLGCVEKDVILVPPGIDPDQLQLLGKNKLREVLNNLGLADIRYILGVGRLVKRKGFDLTIQAFSSISDKFPDVSLVIAGDGPERQAVEQTAISSGIGKRIRILGKVSEEQKTALFQNCEFFVMPNRPVPGDMEGFGIVFLEAGLFGKAVIGGDNGGVRDAIQHEYSGLLVDTSNSLVPLKKAMKTLLSNQRFSDSLGKQGKRRAVQQYNWPLIEKEFEDRMKGQFYDS